MDARHIPPSNSETSSADVHRPTLIALVSGKLLLHLLTFGGYGIFRDELYYLACSRHLAWGFVDHPPLSIGLLTMWTQIFGDSLFAVRSLSALAGAAMIGMVGLLAARLGGGRWAQLMAMLGALIAPMYLGTTHIFSMNIFDTLMWAAIAWQLVDLLDRPFDAPHQPRRWLVLGVLLGLGLLNKISVLWLGAGLGVGLLLSKSRRWLVTPWPWLCGTVSLVIFSPYLLWNHLHGWPTLEFIDNASGQKMVSKSVLDFWVDQLLTMHPLNVVLWVSGLWFFIASKQGQRWRVLGWIFLSVATLLMLSGTSRASYLAPSFTWLLAAGGVVLEPLVRARSLRWTAAGVWLALGAALQPLAVPVLPVDTYVAYSQALGVSPSTSEKKELAELPQFYADMHGWQEITDDVAKVFHDLPESDRASTSIVATNYGVAGAIDYFGPALGLPSASSQHNNYFFWGPKPGDPEPRVIIHLGGPREALEQVFESVELGGVIDCDHCMPYENERPIFVCRGLRLSLLDAWTQGKHFD